MRRLFPDGATISWTKRGEDGESSPRGVPQETWEDPVPIRWCGIAPQTPEEQQSGTRTVARDARAIVTDDPPAAGITYLDRVKLPNGLTYEVDGDAEEWVSPFTGELLGYRFYAYRTKG